MPLIIRIGKYTIALSYVLFIVYVIIPLNELTGYFDYYLLIKASLISFSCLIVICFCEWFWLKIKEY